jgi:hypothetical protein
MHVLERLVAGFQKLQRGSLHLLAALDLLWVALNARDSNDSEAAIRLLNEVVAKYPKTGACQTAFAEPLFQQHRIEPVSASNTSWRGVLIGVELVAMAFLLVVFTWRQMRKGKNISLPAIRSAREQFVFDLTTYSPIWRSAAWSLKNRPHAA